MKGNFDIALSDLDKLRKTKKKELDANNNNSELNLIDLFKLNYMPSSYHIYIIQMAVQYLSSANQ